MKNNGNQKATKRRQMSRFQLGAMMFVAILAVSAALTLLLLAQKGAEESDKQKPAYFGIKSITVEGETRYKHDSIIGLSGITVGQSVLSVNKKVAAQKIIDSFPYIKSVSIDNKPKMDSICIKVEETEPIGAMYVNGVWQVVGSTGRVVEELEITGNRPGRYLYFKGAKPLTGEIGTQAMDDRSLSVIRKIMESTQKHGLDNISEIDLTNLNDIKLLWDNRISICLGNESNVDHQILVAVTSLPKIVEAQGENARGALDMRTYSDANSGNDYAVFTPQDILDSRPGTTTTSKTTSTTLHTTGTTTAH